MVNQGPGPACAGARRARRAACRDPGPPGKPRTVFGSVYAGKINSFFAAARRSSTAFPGERATRGYTGLKAILGNLYGLDIKYYVEVNFKGFREVVDALGGVTVNVQVPLLDDNFPGPGGRRVRLFVPAGMQHMTGSQALDYARSRKSTSDFERGARQQRIIVSLRQQLDIASVLRNINPLPEAVGQSRRPRLPPNPAPNPLRNGVRAPAGGVAPLRDLGVHGGQATREFQPRLEPARGR